MERKNKEEGKHIEQRKKNGTSVTSVPRLQFQSCIQKMS
jgi:hypothetical protein